MPPSEHRADDPDAWIAMAREDLALAEAKPARVSYRPLCFHAQQAAEKATKAVLIAKSVQFPYIHDIGRLLELARSSGLDVPPEPSRANCNASNFHARGMSVFGLKAAFLRRQLMPSVTIRAGRQFSCFPECLRANYKTGLRYGTSRHQKAE